MFLETKREGDAITESKWRGSFLKAAQLLEQNGWCQHTLHNKAGEHCLLGAIYLAHYGKEADKHEQCPAEWSEVFDIIEQQAGALPAPWNDSPGRTLDEVIAVIRRAAVNL